MNKQEIRSWLKDILKNEKFYKQELPDENYPVYYSSLYIGSFMGLDPYGIYARCEVAEDLGAWIESGEGDPTDIYLCREYKEGDLDA